MNLLPALRREEKRLERMVETVQNELNAVQKAIQVFGETYRAGGGRRKMSAATKAKIGRAQRAIWAKKKKAS